ncbi:PASTA domain-containing protein [Desulforhabdus sp. TSK]|uniref:PASTA domain-containing protein n=1 Tax=Desulforhabdus sp. TSK TaxID=2925014 RepID=UPI001FC840CC|nr:PASTA domain-containing protein [Desulforhabdus sp. TSK]GKT07110.1 hypothetical protein DSTSK_04150 [Desulforhabdus sp. TSK]
MEKNRCINDEEFAQQAIDVPAAADRVRLVALDHAAMLAFAKERSLRRELAIQKARLGNDAPQVKDLAERVRLQQVLRVQTAAEIERGETVAPERQSGIFILHGRVVDRQHLGQAGLTVSAVDRSGRPQTYTCTDARGYFKMEIAVKEAAPQSELFLLVSKDGAVLYRGTEAHSVVSEGIVYREIVLGGEAPEQPCPPPPEPQPDRVRVPDVVGRTEAQAQELIKAAKLGIGERTTRPAPNQVGLVLAQSPKGGAQVPIGTAIDLTIGVARMVTVPNVIGLKVEAARETIARAGLAFGVARERESDRPGLVLEQDREGNKEVPAGTLVNVVVGRAR